MIGKPERELAEALAAAADQLFLVVTGAGVSLASGIPTFRGADPDAVWEHSDVEMATFGFFRQDPVAPLHGRHNGGQCA